LDVSRSSAEWGALWRQRGRWFAVRKDERSLIFQTGPRWWRLQEEIDLQVTRGLFRRFQISQAERVEFSVRYVFRGAAAAMVDPTYDRLDEEVDDFFVHVTELWLYWKGRSMGDFPKK
jgi:hypothetical protein